ncbi:MAG: beta strand repeat-containing protein, partial [Planctomycetota bacterium]
MSNRNRKRRSSSRSQGRSWVRKVLDLFGRDSANARSATSRVPTRALGFMAERLEERRVMATLDYVATTGVITLRMDPGDDITMTVTGGDRIRFTDDNDNAIQLSGDAASFFTRSNQGGTATQETATANASPNDSGFRQIRVLGTGSTETFTVGTVSDEELPGLFVDGAVDLTYFDTSLLGTLNISSNSVIVRSPEIVLQQSLTIDTWNSTQHGVVELDDPANFYDSIYSTGGNHDLTIDAGAITISDVGDDGDNPLGNITLNSLSWIWVKNDIVTNNGDIEFNPEEDEGGDGYFGIIVGGDPNSTKKYETLGGDVFFDGPVNGLDAGAEELVVDTRNTGATQAGSIEFNFSVGATVPLGRIRLITQSSILNDNGTPGNPADDFLQNTSGRVDLEGGLFADNGLTGTENGDFNGEIDLSLATGGIKLEDDVIITSDANRDGIGGPVDLSGSAINSETGASYNLSIIAPGLVTLPRIGSSKSVKSLEVVTKSALTISGAIFADDSIRLVVVDSANAGQNLTIGAAVDIVSNSADIVLAAGDNLTIASTAKLNAPTGVSISADSTGTQSYYADGADAGVGSRIEIAGNVIGTLRVGSGPDDDLLVINYANAVNIPLSAAGTSYAGGAGSDTLQISNGSFNTITKTFTNASSGSVNLDGRTISYTGLEPVLLDVGSVANLVFNLPVGANPDVVVGDDVGSAANTSEIRGSTFEVTTFRNPTNQLAVNLGSAGNNVTLRPLDSIFGFSVNGGSGIDSIDFQSAAGLDQRLTVTPLGKGSVAVSRGADAVVLNAVESLRLVGQAADDDSYAILGTTGDDTFNLVPGPTSDKGSITGVMNDSGASFLLVPVSYIGMDVQSVYFFNPGTAGVEPVGGSDTFLISGTDGLDNVLVIDDGTGRGAFLSLTSDGLPLA